MNTYSLNIQQTYTAVTALAGSAFGCYVSAFQSKTALPCYQASMRGLQHAVDDKPCLQYYVVQQLIAAQSCIDHCEDQFVELAPADVCGISFSFGDQCNCAAVVWHGTLSHHQAFALGGEAGADGCVAFVERHFPEAVQSCLISLIRQIGESMPRTIEQENNIGTIINTQQ